MSAIRQRVAQLSRQARAARPTGVLKNTRSYASSHGHDHHEHAHNVAEPLGSAFYITVGTVAASIFVYSISRPSEDGQPSAIHKWFEKISDYGNEWETKNHLMTAALQQAAHDKHLLYHAERSKHYELTYPEVFTQGSPHNVPAGHYINIDKVIAHYKQQHLDEEARKAKRLAAASQ
ncbi:uncharacterized protein B0T15DRAFT_507816 [Chaetomium strumarium]|uniref:NADH-ubiquinone oxidoreductase 17.8 kDa subunit n=1 Tax=Chaetomium strumarium TaxID=1170767 RepID=A0AAJ0H461_9PEZI|nr:hypothetical protein B0T15DRAFT_507816 [Chaetomium strumarium]